MVRLPQQVSPGLTTRGCLVLGPPEDLVESGTAGEGQKGGPGVLRGWLHCWRGWGGDCGCGGWGEGPAGVIIFRNDLWNIMETLCLFSHVGFWHLWFQANYVNRLSPHWGLCNFFTEGAKCPSEDNFSKHHLPSWPAISPQVFYHLCQWGPLGHSQFPALHILWLGVIHVVLRTPQRGRFHRATAPRTDHRLRNASTQKTGPAGAKEKQKSPTNRIKSASGCSDQNG